MAFTPIDSSDFALWCTSRLSSRNEHAMQTLGNTLDQKVPPEVTGAEIQIFLQDEGGAPDIWMYFDGKNKKIRKSDLSIYPGRSMCLDLGLEVLSELESENNHDAANIVKQWFSDCWYSVGGLEYSVPVTLSVHDGWGDGKYLILTNRK